MLWGRLSELKVQPFPYTGRLSFLFISIQPNVSDSLNSSLLDLGQLCIQINIYIFYLKRFHNRINKHLCCFSEGYVKNMSNMQMRAICNHENYFCLWFLHVWGFCLVNTMSTSRLVGQRYHMRSETIYNGWSLPSCRDLAACSWRTHKAKQETRKDRQLFQMHQLVLEILKYFVSLSLSSGKWHRSFQMEEADRNPQDRQSSLRWTWFVFCRCSLHVCTVCHVVQRSGFTEGHRSEQRRLKARASCVAPWQIKHTDRKRKYLCYFGICSSVRRHA